MCMCIIKVYNVYCVRTMKKKNEKLNLHRFNQIGKKAERRGVGVKEREREREFIGVILTALMVSQKVRNRNRNIKREVRSVRFIRMVAIFTLLLLIPYRSFMHLLLGEIEKGMGEEKNKSSSHSLLRNRQRET